MLGLNSAGVPNPVLTRRHLDVLAWEGTGKVLVTSACYWPHLPAIARDPLQILPHRFPKGN